MGEGTSGHGRRAQGVRRLPAHHKSTRSPRTQSSLPTRLRDSTVKMWGLKILLGFAKLALPTLKNIYHRILKAFKRLARIIRGTLTRSPSSLRNHTFVPPPNSSEGPWAPAPLREHYSPSWGSTTLSSVFVIPANFFRLSPCRNVSLNQRYHCFVCFNFLYKRPPHRSSSFSSCFFVSVLYLRDSSILSIHPPSPHSYPGFSIAP